MRITFSVATVCGVIVLASSLVSAAQAAKPMPGAADCFADLMTGKSAEIVCEFPIDPSAAERDELAKTTRGYLKDVHCLVSIRISRAEIHAAINTPDYVFQAPPQPVACELEANLSKDETRIIAVGGLFAPRVVIKDGVAIEATAGLGQITGVSRALSWPAETWVNRGATVRNGMLQAVNAWLGFMRNQSGPQRSSALR
jgi:hypothetical protein